MIKTRYKGYFNSISIKRKLLFSYTISIFIPVLILGIILTYELREMALDYTIRSAYHDVDKIRNKLDETFNILMSVSSRLYIDEEVIEIAEKRYSSYLDLTETIRSFTTFDQYLNYHDQLSNIRLYLENTTFLNTGQFIMARNIRNEPWYIKAVDKNGLISWEYMFDEMKNESVIHLTRLLKDSYGNKIGVLTISMNRDYLYKYLKDETLDIYFIDSDGTVVAAKERQFVGKSINEMEIGKYIGPQSVNGGTIDGEINQYKVKILSERYSPSKGDTDYIIAAVFPTDQIVKEANRRSYLGLLIIFVCLATSLSLIFLFIKAFSQRITVLTSDIHKVAQGELDTTITTVGMDELGQLAKDIGTMIKSIKDLIFRAYEVNLQKSKLELKHKEMQLKILSNQINPHFLFNTLETFRMKALENSQKELSLKIQQLAGLLRASLQAENKEIPLSKEIELVCKYLEIQKYRFEDKINYVIDCPEEYGNFNIPSFIVQPIVENSIIHGIEQKYGRGEVKIIVSRQNDTLIISVTDDGVGMNEEKLEKILIGLSNIESGIYEHIGIINVSRRIQLFYGTEYGLEISAKPGEGTVVKIILPIRR